MHSTHIDTFYYIDLPNALQIRSDKNAKQFTSSPSSRQKPPSSYPSLGISSTDSSSVFSAVATVSQSWTQSQSGLSGNGAKRSALRRERGKYLEFLKVVFGVIDQ